MWSCVIVTSADLWLNGLQPTTPRDNLAVSKAVFIAADVIFQNWPVISQSLAGSRFPGGSILLMPSSSRHTDLKMLFCFLFFNVYISYMSFRRLEAFYLNRYLQFYWIIYVFICNQMD